MQQEIYMTNFFATAQVGILFEVLRIACLPTHIFL